MECGAVNPPITVNLGSWRLAISTGSFRLAIAAPDEGQDRHREGTVHSGKIRRSNNPHDRAD